MTIEQLFMLLPPSSTVEVHRLPISNNFEVTITVSVRRLPNASIEQYNGLGRAVMLGNAVDRAYAAYLRSFRPSITNLTRKEA